MDGWRYISRRSVPPPHPNRALTPEDLREGRIRLMVGCGTLAAYPVPDTTHWCVCGLLHRTSRYVRPRGLEPRTP